MSSISLAYALRASADCSTASAALALIQIADAADVDGCATMTASSLASAMGCSESTARAAIRSLAAEGSITAMRLQHPLAGDVGFLLIVNDPNRPTVAITKTDLLRWAREALRRRSETIADRDSPANGIQDTSYAFASSEAKCNDTASVACSASESTTPRPTRITTQGADSPQPPISRPDKPSFNASMEKNILEASNSKDRAHARIERFSAQVLSHYPGDLRPDTWREFEKVQRERGRPLTPTNVFRFMKFMTQLAEEGQSVEQSVSEAADGRWSRLYPPRKSLPSQAQSTSTTSGDGEAGGHLGTLAALIVKA